MGGAKRPKSGDTFDGQKASLDTLFGIRPIICAVIEKGAQVFHGASFELA